MQDTRRRGHFLAIDHCFSLCMDRPSGSQLFCGLVSTNPACYRQPAQSPRGLFFGKDGVVNKIQISDETAYGMRNMRRHAVLGEAKK